MKSKFVSIFLMFVFAISFSGLAYGQTVETQSGEVISTNAASYRTEVARGSLVAAFVDPGVHRRPEGTRIVFRDTAGKNFDSTPTGKIRLIFASTSQINFYLPPEVSFGPGTLLVTDGNNALSVGTMHVFPVAPGIFSANADGIGPAAAVILRVRSDGRRAYEPTAVYDEIRRRFILNPVQYNPGDQLFLVLFGTGIRDRLSLANVFASVGGTQCEVLYAGQQGELLGLDQVNVRLPASLSGMGQLTVIIGVESSEANRVDIQIK